MAGTKKIKGLETKVCEEQLREIELLVQRREDYGLQLQIFEGLPCGRKSFLVIQKVVLEIMDLNYGKGDLT